MGGKWDLGADRLTDLSAEAGGERFLCEEIGVKFKFTPGEWDFTLFIFTQEG